MKYTFTIRQSTWQMQGKIGRPCWHSDEFHGTGGSGCAHDTYEQAKQRLLDFQKLYGIPDNHITWVGLEPEIEQGELFA